MEGERKEKMFRNNIGLRREEIKVLFQREMKKKDARNE